MVGHDAPALHQPVKPPAPPTQTDSIVELLRTVATQLDELTRLLARIDKRGRLQ